jgi:hypothetical protein
VRSVNGVRSADLFFDLAWPLVDLASYLILRGDHAEARILAEEALSLVRDEGGYWLRVCLQIWALLGALDGSYTAAARLFGWVNAEYSRTGEIREFTEEKISDNLTKLLVANLTPDDLRVWQAEGSVWAEGRAVEFALQRLVSPEF